MAKRIRAPRPKEVRHWRHRNDLELFGRSKDLWKNAESLSPGPRTIEDAADGSIRALAIVCSYTLLAPIIVVTAAEYAAICAP